MVTGLRAVPPVGGPVADHDTFVMHTQPVTLSDGHPLQANACLICGSKIGSFPCNFVSIIVATDPDCACGQVPTITQLVHSWHGVTDTEELARKAVRLADAIHPEAGPPCTG